MVNNKDEIPEEIPEMWTKVMPPVVPKQAFEASYNELKDIENWDKVYTIRILSGLLTELRLHANQVRLDWLIRLVVVYSNGKQKPKRKDLVKILNNAFEKAKILNLEDPIEDLFCDVVSSPKGDKLIFAGHWEQAASCTQTLLRAFGQLPDDKVRDEALQACYALLEISDLVASRAGLRRYSYKEGSTKGEVTLPSNDRLRTLARRTSVTDSDLSDRGLRRGDLIPFFLPPGRETSVSEKLPGDSALDYQPLINLEKGCIVVHPGNITIAIRAHLISVAKSFGMENALLHRLMEQQENFSTESGFWPIPRLGLRQSPEKNIRGSVRTFAAGRFLHILQVCAPFDEFPGKGFGSFHIIDGDCHDFIIQDIERFWEFLKTQQDVRDATTVIIISGWGTGIALELNINEQNAPDGWSFLHLSFSETAIIGACKEGKLRDLERMVKQFEILESQGFNFFNVNGNLNRFATWRLTNGSIIPEDWLDADPPCQIYFPTDGLLKPRIEAANNRDIRTLLDTNGEYVEVQRLEWSETYGLKPIYASLKHAAEARLCGAVVLNDRVWWIELKTSAANERSGWEYQLWKASFNWLSEFGIEVIRRFENYFPPGSFEINLHLDTPDAFLVETLAPPNTAELPETICIDARSEKTTPIVTVSQNWGRFLRLVSNDAEVELAAALFEVLSLASGTSIGRNNIRSTLQEVMPSTGWRWVHASEVKTPLQRLTARGLIGSFEEISLSAFALAKCGAVWRFYDRSCGNTIEGEEACGRFLGDYKQATLKDLISEIEKYDRQSLTTFAIQAYHGACRSSQQWDTTIKAVRSIKKTEADRTALFHKNSINGAKRAAKAIAELAAVVADPSGKGRVTGEIDFEELSAKALILIGNMQLLSALNAGLIGDNLQISPAGDLLSDRTIFDKTLRPAAEKSAVKKFDDAEQTYVRERENEHGIQEKSDQEYYGRLDAVIQSEYHCTRQALVDLAYAITEVCEAEGSDIVVYSQADLLSAIQSVSAYEHKVGIETIERLTLYCRKSWDVQLPQTEERDYDLSRFDRKASLTSRPLLAIEETDNPTIMVSPVLVYEAVRYALVGLIEGTLHGQFFDSKEIVKFAGAQADKNGREFEDEIASQLKKWGFQAWPRKTVPSIIGTRTETDLGDVDVFAISPDKQTVLAIEAKNLKICRNESEVAARMSAYRGDEKIDTKGRKRPDKLRKHLIRVSKLKSNAEKIAKTFSLPNTPKIRGLLVFNTPQPMNFFMFEKFDNAECCEFDELSSKLNVVKVD